MEFNPYDYIDYRKLLKEALLYKKSKFGQEFSFQAMSIACRLQKTYLSKVLNHHGNLDEDQVYLACQFLGFEEDEC